MKTSIRVAIVQEGPAYLNLPLSLQKAELLVKEAATNGTDLVVFGECWFCGYPAWLDHCPDIALWGHEPIKQVYARMLQNGVTVPGPATQLLGDLAKTHQLVIAAGINETIGGDPIKGILYNSFVLFDTNGQMAIHHRKLMPTFSEKMLYRTGDPNGLVVAKTAIGRVGGLICWEHFMPAPRQILHDGGEFLHLALWPSVHEMHQVASRHYAFEGRCFVIAAGQMMRIRDIPPEFELPPHLASEPEEWLLNGGSAVIAPDGFYDLQPQYEREGIIYHTIDDPEHAYRERLTFDAAGHSQRNDLFKLRVKRRKRMD